MQIKDGITYANNSILPATYLISHIHWLNKIRKTTKEQDVITGINISISILLCSYVESVLYEVLLAIIEHRKKATSDNAYLKLLDNTIEKLTKASWMQYLDICEIILLKPLHHYTDNESWKGISLLFNIRNIIFHGKAVNSKLLFKNNKFELECSGVFEKAMTYFKEQKNFKETSTKFYNTQNTFYADNKPFHSTDG